MLGHEYYVFVTSWDPEQIQSRYGTDKAYLSMNQFSQKEQAKKLWPR
jgi:hypothetical protein